MERKFEKGCQAKKIHKGVGVENISTRKKSKLQVWHSYRKNSLNHTTETQKSVLFQFRILGIVYMYIVHCTCSQYLLQTLV